MPLTSGTRLHAYEITGSIGAGGMGEVYRAHDARLGRDVAIKVLPASVASDPVALARFEREAKSIGALNHPNVVNVFDTGSENGIAYVVMELLEGETLRARLQGSATQTPGAGKTTSTQGSSGGKRVGLPRKKVLDFAQHIAQGLAAAHARGLVHRDLKPENVFITSDGRVKILDFGLARAVPEAVQQIGEAQTRISPQTTDSVPGLVLGTVGYMAPEQVRGQAVDHRGDIFSFGAVLFEMLTGERAFDGESPIEVMGAILKEDPLEKPAAAVAISGPIEPLLRHCLEKQPDERFQSARDLAFQLQAIASGTMTTTSAERAVTPSMGAKRILWPAAVVLALGAGAAAGYFTRSDAPSETLALSIPMPPDVWVSPTVSPARSATMAVSRDGRQIAFVGQSAAGNQIYLRPVDAAVARPIAGTEGGSYPAFAPDGRRLAFLQGGKLKTLALDGGTPQVVGDMRNPRSAAAWSDDDALLYHVDYRQPLIRVPASGGAATEVLPQAGDNVSWFSPVFLPGGRRFLVVRFPYADRMAEGAGIYLGSIDSKTPSLLIPGRISEVAVGDGELFYRRGTDLFVQPFDVKSATLTGDARVVAQNVSMAAAGGGTLVYYDPPGGLSLQAQITVFSRSGAVLSRVGAPGTYRDPALSPDGRYLAIARADEHGLFSIWTHDLVRGIDSRITGSTFISPGWTRDSRAILAAATAGLYKWMLGGPSEPETIRSWTDFTSITDTSRDGTQALVQIVGPTTSRFALLALDGKSPPRVVTGELDGTAGSATFSPDGKWMAFVLADGTNRQLVVQPIAGGGPRMPVTGGPAVHPRWHRDGHELYFMRPAPGGHEVMAVPVSWRGGEPDFGAAHLLFKVQKVVTANRWYDASADGQKFVMVIGGDPDLSPLSIRIRVRR